MELRLSPDCRAHCDYVEECRERANGVDEVEAYAESLGRFAMEGELSCNGRIPTKEGELVCGKPKVTRMPLIDAPEAFERVARILAPFQPEDIDTEVDVSTLEKLRGPE